MPAAVRWVVLVPTVTSATAEARAVLPASVPRSDAVFNVQRVALLLAGLQTGRLDVLDVALDDRLHQPYRLRLFPWMPARGGRRAARRARSAACSRARGRRCSPPSATTPSRSRRAMETALRAAGIEGTARTFAVDTEGAVRVP